MIDIHSHLIYGVDDGCKTIDDSLRMIKKAVSVGVTDIILTSHYAPLRGYVVEHNIIVEKYENLKKEVAKEGIQVNLFLGREIDHFQGVEDALDTLKVETINETKYVLIDFGMDKYDIDECCYELIIRGYIPIVAHPERYNYVKKIDEYKKWKRTGALLQINASSLFNTKSKDAKKKAKLLVKEGLVDFIGSDAHDEEEKYDYLLKAHKMLDGKDIKNHILIGNGV